ncbi:hypothetical protein DDB_G0281847 [Dictyostelium discoideum AX4]|uniref:Uncharacterized protein n=1 Tax=Dictyostelium discoideum TaxID=44689 RepID=Q54TD4_DICDI|nr:hypothetical protein DDB_G0281847 [Dictyostelium discoideum AX4]EAL66483.1 hypothetical protein DDB_G0281847 [Dictyostelium discoideum AX4]|eukprot:XP_640455.1 hypothetical protein DDB_G0281847 [Dictyostelium discoideum AX4]
MCILKSAPPTNIQLVRTYRSLLRKASNELKYTNFEYFRLRLNNSFKEPVEDDYEKFRKYQVCYIIYLFIYLFIYFVFFFFKK